jgi:hypothetical protein
MCACRLVYCLSWQPAGAGGCGNKNAHRKERKHAKVFIGLFFAIFASSRLDLLQRNRYRREAVGHDGNTRERKNDFLFIKESLFSFVFFAVNHFSLAYSFFCCAK